MEMVASFSPVNNPSDETLIVNEFQSIDSELLQQQRDLLLQEPTRTGSLTPFSQFTEIGNDEHIKRGKKLIREGKVGCLLLAGGQGSRLRFSGPKGCYPISVIKNKTLFQLCAEKVLAAGKQAGRPLYLAIMTSHQNHKEVIDFFKTNSYFGLSSDQISFFPQSDLPLLTPEGKLFLESPDQISKGPDGNGRCLEHLYKSGIWSKWKASGVSYINMVLIDNPLADPFDAELIGFADQRGVDVAIKCTEKRSADEKVGVLIMEDNKCRVIEYSEMPDSAKKATTESGKLLHRCANLSLFCFSMDFAKNIATSDEPLPLHKAWKAVPYMDENGNTVTPTEPNAWKFEAFIFDVLARTEKVAALLYPRDVCFAPLKNASGADSPQSVRDALQNYERKVIEEITGLQAPEVAFELDQQFYYPTEEMVVRWKGKRVTGGYIQP